MVNDIVQEVVMRIRAITDNSVIATRVAMDNVSQGFQNASRRASNFGIAMSVASKQTQKLNWHLLSTLFFGMQIGRTFGGLLQPAMDAAGIFEIIGSILEIFFLPFALALLDPLLWLMDFFLNLPEPVQFVVGSIFALIAVFGNLLFWLSQFGLVTPAMMTMFGTAIGAAITLVVSSLAGLVGAFAALPVTIIAIIILLVTSILFNIEGFAKTFSDLIDNTMESVADIFEGGWELIEGIIDTALGVIDGLLTGNWDKFNSGVRTFIDGLIQLFTGLFNTLTGNMVKFGFDLMNAFATGIINAYGFIKSAIRGIPLIGPLIAGGLDVVDSFAKGIVNAISNAVGGISSGISKGFKGLNIPGFAEGGIVNRPTLAMVGEAGPEAIIPLSGGASYSGGVGSTVYAPQVSLNAVINNELDIKEVAEQVNRYLVEDYKRVNFA